MIADEAHRSQYDLIDGYAGHLRDTLVRRSATRVPLSRSGVGIVPRREAGSSRPCRSQRAYRPGQLVCHLRERPAMGCGQGVVVGALRRLGRPSSTRLAS